MVWIFSNCYLLTFHLLYSSDAGRGGEMAFRGGNTLKTQLHVRYLKDLKY